MTFKNFMYKGVLMIAVLARIKNSNGAESVFFFGTIGNMKLEKYKEKIKKRFEC